MIWLIAIIAVVALVLAILAFTRANMTGNTLFGFINKPSPQPTPNEIPSYFCEVKTSSDCYGDTSNFSECDSCVEICDHYSFSFCDYAGRAKFEGNYTTLPHYYAPYDCSGTTSMVQFRLYCNCCR